MEGGAARREGGWMRRGKVRSSQKASRSAVSEVNLPSNRRLWADPGDLHWNTAVTAQIPGTVIYIPQVIVPFGYQTFSPWTYSCCSFFWWQRKRKVGGFSVYGSFYGNHLLLTHLLYGATLHQGQLGKGPVHHTVADILKAHGKQSLPASRLFLQQLSHQRNKEFITEIQRECCTCVLQFQRAADMRREVLLFTNGMGGSTFGQGSRELLHQVPKNFIYLELN